jgi:enoyl-CoA hydratase/carnithine racemase
MVGGMVTPALVRSEVDAGVALITLNRPERMNAWTMDLQADYFDALQAAVDDAAVVAIVVTGAGRAFCVGADTEVLDGVVGGDEIPTERGGRSIAFPFSVPKPMIAAINGSAAGIGLVNALFCDLRFANPGVKLTTSFARRGLVAESGVSWLLPQIVGRSRALDLLLSGRIVLAEEGLAMGLVDRVAGPGAVVDEAIEYAKDVAASCAPSSMATMKDQLARHPLLSFADALADSEGLTAASLSGPAFAEGLASYMERRAPDFPPFSA